MPLTVEPTLKTVGDYAEAYEAARLRDGYAELSAFLPHPDDPLWLAVLRELVRIEMEYAWERGQPRRLAEYRGRFPQLFADRESLRLITFEDFRLRYQAGQNPSPAEYARQFGVDPRSWPPLPNGARSVSEGEPSTLPHVLGAAGAEAWAELRRSSPGTAERCSQAVGQMPSAGAQFLGFRLHAELGRGAFGRVFLAQQGDLAHRWVALKIAPDLWGESQTLAQLQHTHIVPIYSVHQAGALQAVCMPYFGATTLAHVLHDVRGAAALPESGKSLLHTLDTRKSVTRLVADPSTHTNEGRPDSEPPVAWSPGHLVGASPRPSQLEGLTYVDAVLWLAVRLADGLAHAHERGILHRDLKPANILLTDDGQPMLLDFNLSEDTKERGAAVAQVGGTLPYMAPEHLEAFRDGQRPVDARSDLYAFGVILFELLTGRHPFPLRRGPLGTLLPEMITDRMSPPPALRCWNQAVSPAVEALVRRCLEPVPEQRYASVRALHEDLQRQLDHLPLRHTREPSFRERLTKWRRRHPRVAAALTVGTAALLLLTGLTGGFLSLYHRQQREVTDLKVLGGRDTLNLLQKDLQHVRRLLCNTDADDNRHAEGLSLSRHIFQRYGVFDTAAWLQGAAVREWSATDRAWLGETVGELLLHNAGIVLRRAETTAAAEKRAELLDEVQRLHAAAATCWNETDAPRSQWLQRATWARLAGQDTEAQHYQDRAAGQPLRAITDHWLLLADHQARGRYGEALSLLTQLRDSQPRNYALCLALANCFAALRQTAEAEVYYRQAMGLEPDAPDAPFFRGVLYLRQKYYEPACADFEQVLLLRPDHQAARYNRAAARFALGNLAGALDDLNVLLQEATPPLRAYLLRARVLELRGERAAARKDREEAQRRPPTSARDWNARGEARAAREPRAALADLDQALALHPGLLDAWQSRAHILAEYLARPEEALAALDKALALQPDSVPALAGRGVLLARLGRRDAALRDAQAALAHDRQPATLYQVGCIWALTSRAHSADRAEALRLVSAALRQGYGVELLDKDHDLDPVRELPEFRRLVQAARELRGTR